MAKIKKRVPITKGTTKTLPGPALIRKFHKLQAQLQAAKTAQDDKAITSVQAEIDELGGIEQYQKASIKGQDKRRGGDSSKQLVEWLKTDSSLLKTGKTKVLEIGCLSTDNYISKYSPLEVTRIDLNPQHPDITQQDFLDRKVETLDGISLSLVLNFVPITKRCEFLLHLVKFLPPSAWLFLVLPAPCITNSRYMTKKILLEMMATLGFTVLKEKVTDKIAYWLLKRDSEVTHKTYKKQEILNGPNRNNFWIPLST